MASKKTKGPSFLRFVGPIVETLRELGNSGTASEVADRVLDRLGVSEGEQEETTSNGHSRVRNQIGWARFYLAKAGYLDASQRGVWSLTEAGRTAKLDTDAVQTMLRDVRKKFPRNVAETARAGGPVEEDEEADAETAEEEKDYKVRLLEILRALPPSGFERICQRLLRESGFQQVVVTGSSGDGGIDGHGVL
jgi:restriction system protein